MWACNHKRKNNIALGKKSSDLRKKERNDSVELSMRSGNHVKIDWPSIVLNIFIVLILFLKGQNLELSLPTVTVDWN